MRESIQSKKSRMSAIVEILKREYPDSKCSLIFDNPFQLLVSTILSAQCTDARVNKVTSKIYKRYKNPSDFSKLSLKEIKKMIYSTGFYNNKAKSIYNLSYEVLNKYNGEIPRNMEDLVSLPGVGRKTANVVLGTGFQIPGIVVDTHVTRLANLLKVSRTRNAVIIERELEKIIDKENWIIFTHLIIDHGRKICVANRPKCSECAISDFCPSSEN
tara:strand:- start:282 stop:926 length:645 start_codon:yes stop_codon:yes gene_type:complete